MDLLQQHQADDKNQHCGIRDPFRTVVNSIKNNDNQRASLLLPSSKVPITYIHRAHAQRQAYGRRHRGA
jgi:hypothetical protein